MGTLRGYVTSVRRFLTFCIKYKVDATTPPYDPTFMCYWLSHEVKSYGNAQSLRNWEAAVSWLGLCVAQIDNTSWFRNTEYRQTRRTLIFRYKLPPQEKMPFTLKHLVLYTKYRKITPLTYWTAPFDDLLEILWLQMLFLTLSRPCELLRRPGDETKMGLKWGDFKYKNHHAHYFLLKVWHFKNQKARREPKDLTLSNTSCGSTSCDCWLINPYKIFYVLLKRRQELASRQHLTKRQRKHLPTSKDNYIFVRQSGHELTTKNTKIIIEDMARVTKVLEPHKYTEYSLRVGGATHCAAAGIPDALMYRYVGWDPTRLPDSARRYQRPTLEMRLQFPHAMLHGFTNEFGHHHQLLPTPGLFFDPWNSNQPELWQHR